MKKITLTRYRPTYLWICGVGFPAGEEWCHDTETEGEEYCNFDDFDAAKNLWGLSGTVDSDGLWEWDGMGTITDYWGNEIYNVKARK